MTDFKQIFHSYAKENHLAPDLMQDKAVDVLNSLYNRIVFPTKTSWFSKPLTVKGVYLWGGVGRGKTMIMDLFYAHLPIKEKRRVHFNIFMLDVHNNIKLLREEGKGKNPLQNIAKEISETCRILCFDEFQVYDIADAMVLSELFKELFAKNVTVVVTSNVAPDDLYKDGLQRSRFLPFIPLVKKQMDIIHLDGSVDYRQQALREDGVYFVQTVSKMKQLFDKITSPVKPKKETLDVKGRELPIEKAAGEVAWIDFSELCEKPRAAADYQVLAQSYRTVFIDNVPRMGYDRRNEAKRFILLVDTLYDADTHLVINAEVIPQKLYHGDDHAFEFERTVSRLLEMQGEEYLSKTSCTKVGKI